MACITNGTRVEILLRNSTHRAIVLPMQYFRLKVIENHGHPAPTASTSQRNIGGSIDGELGINEYITLLGGLQCALQLSFGRACSNET